MSKTVEPVKEVTIRFAGDSGDGMQLVGNELANTSALLGNDISILPDFPAEIRAPAGTLPGVSGYQLHFSSFDIHTPGEYYDALIAMNPAGLKMNIDKLKPNGILIVNTGSFRDRNLQLAHYESNPLEDGSLDKFQVFDVDITTLTRKALEELNLSNKVVDRCKNFFALGMVFWLYNRSMDHAVNFIKTKFSKKPELVEANLRALKGGYAYCEATEQFATSYEVKPAKLAPGKYRSISGNAALALGLITAAQRSGLPMFYGSYPITPASDVLHELSKYKHYDVRTFQAEDEIAAVCSAIGASYTGAIGVTGTSGPGLALKTEALGLAISVELPLVVCDIQRAGPSTGMPTKTEQSDLLQALFGRNSDAPVPVVAASRPSDCFEAAYEACRIAVQYMTPVILLSDGYIANGAEPWPIPNVEDLPEIPVKFEKDAESFAPFLRDEDTLTRSWAIPGTPGLEHRIGGLEKEAITGHVSYDPRNHEYMTNMRFKRIQRIADDLPPTKIEGAEKGELLVLGWGSTYGSIKTAVERKQEEGKSVSRLHLRHLNPLPKDLGYILQNFEKVLVPEINMGQLLKVLRAEYLIPAIGFSKVQGLPFMSLEIEEKIDEILGDK
ncbi:2-oxoacid:acceptor oxidoreductase subunit alpha [candidate division KSB1 bacterium]|nr:2-oxoacid:acceptor oxidoreductase subunit alpha [candidate division KSB1 bacterium]